MNLFSFVKRVNNNAQEIKALGLFSMMRHFYRIIFKNKDLIRIKTRIGDIYLRPLASDNIVMSKIFVDREYDIDRFSQGAKVRKKYEEIIANGKTPLIIDAGGNIGLASRFLADAYPKATIVTVEPDPENCKVARKNVFGYSNINLVEAAIGGKTGFVSINENEVEAWAIQTKRANGGIPILTINNILERQENCELFIVKIDIEGFESDLFSANVEWAEEAMAIAIEPHDWLLPGAGSSSNFQRTLMNGNRDILIVGENIIMIKNGS